MRFLGTAVLAALLATTAAAQPAGETIEVHLLEVEAVVLDRQGKPVAGLREADFEVLVGGRPASIVNFYPVQRGAVVDAGSTAVTTAQAPSHLVIFIDDLHLHRRGKKRALDALKKYVAMLPPATQAMLVRWNGTLTVRVPATGRTEELARAIAEMDAEPPALSRYDSDRRAMLRAIDGVADRNTQSKIADPANATRETNIINQERADAENETERPDALAQQVTVFAETYARETQNTIAALRDVVGMMKGLEGRKTLLYISEGLPLQPGAEVIDYWSRLMHEKIAPRGEAMDSYTRQFSARPSEVLRHDQTARFLELVKDAQAARVAFSSVDPAGAGGFGDSGPEEPRSSSLRMDSTLSSDNQRSAVRMVTEETGGRYFADDNDLDAVMGALADQVGTYYSLAVRAPSAKANVAVSVRVKDRKDVRVLTARRQQSALREEVIVAGVRARLYSRQSVNPLEARVTIGAAWPDGRGCSVPVQILLPPGKLTLIDGTGQYAIHAVVLDGNQRESKVQTLTRTVKPGEAPIVETIRFGFKPSRYVVSIAIVDQRTGETSYLQADVDTTVCGS